MNKKRFTPLVSAAAFGVCLLAATQASATGPKDSTNAGDKYGYALHNGKRDPFTDGARVGDRRDPFTDGAHGSAAAALDLAGRDLTGVSAPPAHGAAARRQASA